MIDKEWLNPQEAANYLGFLGRDKMQSLIKSGYIKGKKVGAKGAFVVWKKNLDLFSQKVNSSPKHLVYRDKETDEVILEIAPVD